MVYWIARLLRLTSSVMCLIVASSFVLFALEQTESASGRQQEQLSVGTASASTGPTRPSPPAAKHEGLLREAIDDAANEITSPFAGVVAGSSSEWVVRGGKLLLAFLAYGFGVGYLARVLRVRA